MSGKKTYEVYICRYDGDIVYIGEGSLNRHLHCTSGTSHVFELNELYFLGDKTLFTVDVNYFQTKDEASAVEVELIKVHKPKFNKKGNGVVSILERKHFRKLIVDNLRNMRKTQTQHQKLMKCVDEFLTFHTDKMLKEEGICFRKRHIYEKCGLKQLSTIVSNIQQGNLGETSMPRMFKEALENAYKEFYQT